jgi:hypothetical protein
MDADIRILSTDLTEALQSYIERRLHFSMGRFGRRMGRVRVRIRTSMAPGEERISRARFPRNSSARIRRSCSRQWTRICTPPLAALRHSGAPIQQSVTTVLDISTRRLSI